MHNDIKYHVNLIIMKFKRQNKQQQNINHFMEKTGWNSVNFLFIKGISLYYSIYFTLTGYEYEMYALNGWMNGGLVREREPYFSFPFFSLLPAVKPNPFWMCEGERNNNGVLLFVLRNMMGSIYFNFTLCVKLDFCFFKNGEA